MKLSNAMHLALSEKKWAEESVRIEKLISKQQAESLFLKESEHASENPSQDNPTERAFMKDYRAREVPARAKMYA